MTGSTTVQGHPAAARWRRWTGWAWIQRRGALTERERHNLRMQAVPVAVLTASLGGHPQHYPERR